jgi:charged multivesicular body protein 2A
MMQAMKGATGVLGNMNKSMNLPALQRIAMEFERENDIMDQRQEMMDDAIDDVTGLEDEADGEEIVEQVLEEIGIDLKNAVSDNDWYFDLDADGDARWVKLPKGCRVRLFQKERLPKLLAAVVEVIQGITTFKQDLIA